MLAAQFNLFSSMIILVLASVDPTRRPSNFLVEIFGKKWDCNFTVSVISFFHQIILSITSKKLHSVILFLQGKLEERK